MSPNMKNGEVIYKGDLLLSKSQDVKIFAEKYPNCIDITGNLGIYGEVSNLECLRNLKKIGGSLRITNNKITNLNFLSHLVEIAGELYIEDNKQLLSLQGLENLLHIKSDGKFFSSWEEQGLFIEWNPKLIDISALKKITKIAFSLVISNNNELKTLIGLNNIQNVGILGIGSNPELVDISALNNLRHVAHHIFINNNDKLISIDCLKNVKSVGKGIYFRNNALIEDMDGLPAYQAKKSVVNELEMDFVQSIEKYIPTVQKQDIKEMIDSQLKSVGGLFIDASEATDFIYAFAHIFFKFHHDVFVTKKHFEESLTAICKWHNVPSKDYKYYDICVGELVLPNKENHKWSLGFVFCNYEPETRAFFNYDGWEYKGISMVMPL